MASNQFDSLRLELRRGFLVIAVLAQLRAEHYGYTLKRELDTRGLDIDEGTLYPLLLAEWQQINASMNRIVGGSRSVA